ncbi:MAG: hypothetical protein NT157_01475 [Candidatus Micrarchaeota archaeon]|nr:hypothetical protein [Candidatus Micrarchaeota archaeon]
MEKKPPMYLGDALNFVYGNEESEKKANSRRTFEHLKAGGWEFSKFDEKERIFFFKKESWQMKIKISE